MKHLRKLLIHQLYEATVQNPKWHIEFLPQFHEYFFKKMPLSFREDFSGTGLMAVEWAKQSKKHRALGIDNDAQVLAIGKKLNLDGLPSDVAKRISFKTQTVLRPTSEKFDMIGAFNYSYFIFHTRSELLKYAKAVYRSLNTQGSFFVDIAGGPGFCEAHVESQVFTVKDVGAVTQVWEQQCIDPITSLSRFALHFELPSGERIQNAFTYHWRIWSIQEVREVFREAGFNKTVVLWSEFNKKGEPTGHYLPSETAKPHHSWNAIVLGVKF